LLTAREDVAMLCHNDKRAQSENRSSLEKKDSKRSQSIYS